MPSGLPLIAPHPLLPFPAPRHVYTRPTVPNSPRARSFTVEEILKDNKTQSQPPGRDDVLLYPEVEGNRKAISQSGPRNDSRSSALPVIVSTLYGSLSPSLLGDTSSTWDAASITTVRNESLQYSSSSSSLHKQLSEENTRRNRKEESTPDDNCRVISNDHDHLWSSTEESLESNLKKTRSGDANQVPRADGSARYFHKRDNIREEAATFNVKHEDESLSEMLPAKKDFNDEIEQKRSDAQADSSRKSDQPTGFRGYAKEVSKPSTSFSPHFECYSAFERIHPVGAAPYPFSLGSSGPVDLRSLGGTAPRPAPSVQRISDTKVRIVTHGSDADIVSHGSDAK
ncbi:uncharacterized protein LOC125177726 [Hyalella azteca]|uniref:Uncharacterized protein LOC125177726 n=1 Tax=Hyalella azteca TaxID=294128 RepID=A0A979FGD0_HYAAZ|nr:uncharacterized protein LOC125177726 [Hyalella azteca]